jgi:hypothetical protein
MDVSTYTIAQYVQLFLCTVYYVLVRACLRRTRTTWASRPFLMVVLGYSVLCAVSNLMRESALDRTALWVIPKDEYLRGTLMWWLSLFSATAAYLAVHARFRNVSRTRRPSVRSSRCPAEYFYAALFLVGLTAFAFNPYRNVVYGHLNPSSPDVILIGGLLVGGIFTMMLTAGALGLFLLQPVWGAIPAAAAVGILTYSGSKGISALFVIYVAYVIWRMRHGRLVWKIASFLLPLVIYGSGLALREAVVFRYGGSEVPASAAVSMAISRFSQEEVFAVLWANPEWVSDFRPLYSLAQVTAFVPGFLWSGKPHNPAYEIDALYARNGPVSAASPSVFGSLLIMCGRWGLLPSVVLLGVILSFLDRRTAAFGNYHEIEWTYVYSIAMIFETVYVLAVIGISLSAWCLYATRYANMRSRPAALRLWTVRGGAAGTIERAPG